MHKGDVVTVHWYPDSGIPIGTFMANAAALASPQRVWLTEASGPNTCNDIDFSFGISNIINAMDAGSVPSWTKTFIYHLRTTSTCGFTLINPDWGRRYAFHALAAHYNSYIPSGILSPGKDLRADEACTVTRQAFQTHLSERWQPGALSMDMVPLWHTSTHGSNAFYTKMQNDGNFVVYDVNVTPLWHSFTFGNPGSYLKMQNDGNLVVYNPSNVPLWWSGTCCY